MADYTLSSGSICRPFRSPWGAFPTRTFGVSTGTSSNGVVMGRRVTTDFAESNPTTNAGYVKGSTGPDHFYLAGIVAEKGNQSSAVASTPVCVWECNPLVEFRAATFGGVLASSNVGQTKKLTFESTLQVELVDLTGSTAADHRIVITQLIDNPGDSGGYVAFRFVPNRADQGSTVLSSTPFLAFYR
jgi:hypothetical protein